MQSNLLKVRCSGISEVTASLNEDKLPVGALTYLDKWIKEARWNRRKTFKAKVTTKGNYCEDESIENIMLSLGIQNIKKNTERKENNFISGECDIDVPEQDLIIDAKNSWGLETFPMYADKLPDKKYESQIRGYMNLWQRSNGVVCYVLMDCPLYMIKDAIQKEIWLQQKEDPDIFDISYEDKIYIVHQMCFTSAFYHQVCRDLKIDKSDKFQVIPLDRRIKTFEIKQDNSFIESLENRVNLMNNYLKNTIKYQEDYLYLLNKINQNVSTN